MLSYIVSWLLQVYIIFGTMLFPIAGYSLWAEKGEKRMIPVMQQIRHDPDNGQHGDCQRAVIASLLEKDIEEVPHFNEGGPEDHIFFERLDAYLLTQGYLRFTSAYSCDLATILLSLKCANRGIFVMLGGNSPRGFSHVVIAADGEIVHDPHPDGGGIIGPNDDGLYYVETLVSICMATGERNGQ